MRILTVHNKYRMRGGEDESRESKDTLLRERGHTVRELVWDNHAISTRDHLRIGVRAVWNRKSYDDARHLIQEWKPDIVDVHNFFPQCSPAIHYAAFRLGIPVVQTLHNFRLLCPGATFYRDGGVCEDCTRFAIPIAGVLHRCYRNSTAQTASVALMIATHRLCRTWHRTVSTFVALSEFSKRKFVQNGFPESRIYVKPNFVLDPGPPGDGGSGFLFVGRLSREKGVLTLIAAMERLRQPIRLTIIGEGPLGAVVRSAATLDRRIEYLGRLTQREVLDRMAQADWLVFPSESYETFGRVAAEAFARGTPVIASRIGAVAEIVDHGRTGLHFTPGDADDLAAVLAHAAANGTLAAKMRREARIEYEAKYSPDCNYDHLMNVYERARAASANLLKSIPPLRVSA